MQKKVDFFIVGAPKCGTTALASYLSEHPGVAFSSPKEPHFFATDIDRKRKIRDLDHYHSIFPDKGLMAKRGEASVWYLYSEEAVANIKSYNPNAKIIVMIREPVDFIESLHNQNVIGGHDREKNIDESVRNSLKIKNRKFDLDYVELARFEKYIRKYKKEFDDRVLVLFQEELKAAPQQIYRQVLDFLDIEDDGRADFGMVNVRRRHKFKLLELILTVNWSPISRVLSPLRKLLGVGSFGIYKRVMDFNSEEHGSEGVSDATTEILVVALNESVEKMSDFVSMERLKKHWKRFF